MLQLIIPVLLAHLWPSAPAWVAPTLTVAIPEVVEAVQELVDDDRISPSDTIIAVRDLVDDAFDEIPGWADEPEERRDLIVNGFAELAMLVAERSDGRRSARRIRRKLRRHLREAV